MWRADAVYLSGEALVEGFIETAIGIQDRDFASDTSQRGAGMNEMDTQKLVIVLDAIRDNQTLQLDRQLEALTLQREQLAMDQRQVERAERLQERAEQLQGKSAQLVAGARKLLVVMLPIVVVLIGYVSWLLLR